MCTRLVLQQDWEHDLCFPAESDLVASGKHSDITEHAPQMLMSSCRQHEVIHGNVCRHQIASVYIVRIDCSACHDFATAFLVSLLDVGE